MTASKCCAHQAVRLSLPKGEREVQAVGEVVPQLVLLVEAQVVVLLVLVEVEVAPLVDPLVGEVAQT